MSDQDRGAYTPPSDRLSFDPREPVRSGGPAPVTLIVSGVVLLAIVVGVFLLYRGGVRHKGDAPTMVGAPIAQMKTPAPPDANDIPPGLVVSRVDASNAANATYAPPPEEPLPRPLPVQATPVVISTPLPPPTAVAPRPAATPKPPPAKPLTIASLTDDAMTAKPPPKAAPVVTPPAPVVPTPAVAASGGSWVQVGAFSSSALADKGWSDASKLVPAAMSGKGEKVEPVSKDGKTFYRAYVTGFAGHDAAQAFCEKLKAAGKACFVK